MKLVSANCVLPRKVEWHGRSVTTAIYKEPVKGRELPPGMFGENFTVEGVVEDSVYIGDPFSIGSAEVVVTQPRLPCYKLGVRFESDDMVRRFLASRRTGFYVAVTHEGEVGSGDEVTPLPLVEA